MNSKRFIKLSLSLTLILLILVASVQIAIDPLFQYHKPWFGLEPFIKKERYQDAGMAKTFDFENVIMGTSMAQNFRINEYEELFGGKTIKLTMEGSHPIDWTYVLEDLSHRKDHPKTILLNLDPYVFRADTEKLKHELPIYLYDYNFLNDVNYWFNYQIIHDFTAETIIRNIKHDIPNENDAFVWEKPFGKEYVLSQYERADKVSEPVAEDIYKDVASDNMGLLIPYIESMSETRFIFFCSPFSMVFWDGQIKDNSIETHKQAYLSAIGELLEHDNVSIYLWTDDVMLGIMSDLDNYADEAHYSEDINSLMLQRIAEKQGLLTQDNYQAQVDKLFEYLEKYDYERLFI